ncbi:MAG: GspE/PulE family protein [Candidatus Komeilibacteria bacterium]|nr:GspE/PulE family protein [Candidatus Komeilibacteria bacterium]
MVGRESLLQQLLNLLLERSLITSERFQRLVDLLRSDPQQLANELNTDPTIPAEELARVKATVFQMDYFNLEGKELDSMVVKILPQDLAKTYAMLIVGKDKDELQVALVDPANFKAMEAIEFLARKKNYRVKYLVISQASWERGYKAYGDLKEEVGQAVGQAQEKFAPKEVAAGEAQSLEEIVKSAPVAKIVSVIFRHAIEGGASDIHIEPQGQVSRIRYRVDGILHTSLTLPIYLHAALVSRIKVIANLKIDETRVPQDGRIRISIAGRDVDLRVSTLPLLGQEKVVMRILESQKQPPTFADLGFMGQQLELMNRNLTKQTGMFLVTGPTGSGKSTTLFSALGVLNKEHVNISTLEDPIEYFVAGVNQSQINPEVGFTFASGLRSLLRQDPNILMVGEIRDSETTELAIHAALTGHVVLSTLHTNDAIGTIPRFIDMGGKPFLLAATLNIVVAQRLVRKICPKCKEIELIPEDIQNQVQTVINQIPPAGIYPETPIGKKLVFYHGAGCASCGGTGYKGRLVVSEVINVSAAMREIIAKGFPTDAVKKELLEQKFMTMTQDGWLKVLLGLTTAEEILGISREE